MSPHRYTPPIPPAAVDSQRPEPLTVLLFVLAIVAAIALELLFADPAPGTPVPTPSATAFPLEPMDGQHLAAIRVEAFHAGLAEGLQQGGCSGAAALSYPVARR